MTTLAVRAHDEEQMDSAELDPETYAKVLRDLARINRWTFTARSVLRYLDEAVGRLDRVRLLDVGFGAGDMLRAVARWAKQRGIDAELVGVDLNPRSEAIARDATPSSMRISYRTGDYRDVPGPFDFVISSQVAHHMSDRELDGFIRFMEETARHGWLIADLHRHRFAHAGFPLLARLLGVHRIVRQDGTLSIARSFRPGEWADILARTGVRDGVEIVRRFPFRLSVERIR
jgi:2-polyprenyl-3-methyl-5-hydroxy-6-metoxy-1,4-benzoquinol methylase